MTPAIKDSLMAEPLSSIPDLIEMIRRERDEWKARAEAASSIPDLIEMIRRERDEWKARAEAAERKLTDRAQCCVENEERVRVRDARVEPPEVEIEILAWNGPFWTAAFLHRDRKTLVFCDPDFGAGPIERAPYWLPMPPDPEGK